MPPPSAGGVALLECLNVLEGYDVTGDGLRLLRATSTTSSRRCGGPSPTASRWLGDPAFVKDMPTERLVSKEYAAGAPPDDPRGPRLRLLADDASSGRRRAPRRPTSRWSTRDRNVVALTYTLEDGYGSKIVVPGAGFLLNNEMGDFNAGPGLTDDSGLVGTEPNLAGAGQAHAVEHDADDRGRGTARPCLVTGSPGGRTIPSTVLLTLLNVLDFGMNAQEAVDAPRFHHQWLPDVIQYERHGLSADTVEALAAKGHKLQEIESQGVAEAILVNAPEGLLEGGCDRRAPDGAAIGQ